MAKVTDEIRRFSVHARHEDAHHARVLEESSFEAAAVAYVEHLVAPAGAEHEISVVVRDLESGHQHAFRVDLDTGDAARNA